MTTSRGTHQTTERAILPSSADASQSEQDDKTPISWWVKTVLSWTLLGAAVALLAAMVVIPRLTGSTAYTVLTGSMEPNYPPGTMIVVKPTPGEELHPGDVITFQPKAGDPAVTTHRIVSIFFDADGQRRFVTKGDANNVTDDVDLVSDQIRGKLIYSVPFIGRVNSLISGQSRSIIIFLIAGGLGLYALWMWISGMRDRGKSDDEPPAPDEQGQEESVQASPSPVCHACGQPAPPMAGPPDIPPLAYDASTRHQPVAGSEITRPIPVIK